METLKEKIKKALNYTNDDFDFYRSDLYVRRSPELMAWLKTNYEFFANCQTFTSNKDQKQWVEIPFANDDFWNSRGGLIVGNGKINTE